MGPGCVKTPAAFDDRARTLNLNRDGGSADPDFA